MPYWRWLIRRLVRKIWFRATVISLLAVGAALASAALAPYFPYDLSLKIGGKAADNLLTILASSMLAVTTFSLTAMVAAFSGAAQNITPRATQLLVEDSTAQNALSTFLGGFLFGIVGIAALSTGYYGEQGRAMLFLFTMAMILFIAVTLLGWIQTLAHFGRVPDTVRRVEKAGLAALERDDRPRTAIDHDRRDLPAEATTVLSLRTGYVATIDTSELCDIAKQAGATIHVIAAPGTFVDPRQRLAWTDAKLTDEQCDKVADSFAVAHDRTYDHDPRFAMVVLAEIASRALSPAVNDPGTAIASLVAGQRIAEHLCNRTDEHAPIEGVALPPLSLEEMIEDLALPIARDGAGMVEVGIRLQHMLGSLAKADPTGAAMLRRIADDAMSRANSSSMAEFDRSRLAKAHRTAFA